MAVRSYELNEDLFYVKLYLPLLPWYKVPTLAHNLGSRGVFSLLNIKIVIFTT